MQVPQRRVNEAPSGDTTNTQTTDPTVLAQEAPYNPVTNNYEEIPTVEVENPKVEIVEETKPEPTTETSVAKTTKTTGILSGLGAAVTSLFAGI